MRRAPAAALAFGLLAFLASAVPAGAGAHGEARARVNPAQVLLLHSYHKGFPWTDNVTVGVERAFAAGGDPVELAVEFMDTKRKSDEEHLRSLFALYREKFRPGFFRVVVTVDDDALIFALRYRAALFPGVPVVFCGLSRDPAELLTGQDGVTGIVETQDIAQTLELIPALHRGVRRIVAINDLTTTGLARQRQIDDAARFLAGKVAVETVADVTADELGARLKQLTAQDAVFLQMFNRDRAGRLLGPGDIMEIIRSSTTRPVYTIKEEYLGLGVVGGYLTDGKLHGEAVGRIVLRILGGADVAATPIVRESINLPQFDDARLRQFRISPGALPAGSVRINLPVPFLVRHREVVTWMVAAVLALLLTTGFLATRGRILRRAEEDLAFTLHSIGDAVIATDGELRVTRLNPAAEHLTGWTSLAARRQPIAEVFRARHAATGAPVLSPGSEAGASGATTTTLENAILSCHDGLERQISGSVDPILDRSGAFLGLVVVFRDVSERLQMEERVRQGQKMETVGRLAGGIAHDFNNLLGGIIGYADLIIAGAAGAERLRGYAERIIETAERAAGLSRNLQAFSRKGQLHAVSIDLHQAILDVIGILEQTIDRRIAVTPRLEAARPLVTGDLSQIQSALLNLGVNARDAMPEGGTISFATAEVTLDAEAARAFSEPVEPGRYIAITVSDTGEGIDPEVLPHIFEPFYTTKPVGRGTGLGLAAVYGIVRGHHGVIEVESAPGAGARFRICLPAAAETGRAPQKPEGRRATAGCVLLVDDEAIIRGMARDMLRELGYEVLTAADGDEGLEVFRREQDRISLVILDVVMPKRSGPETLRAIHAIRPGTPVLISSGFDLDAAALDLQGAGVSGFLQKPFRITDISQQVAKAIAAAKVG